MSNAEGAAIASFESGSSLPPSSSIPNVVSAPYDDLNEGESSTASIEQWTPTKIVVCILLMGATGVFEIMGGWLIWRAVRGNPQNENENNNDDNNNKKKSPWWFAILGAVSLIIYGYLPTLQPINSFGRIYAVYGGFFIVLSFLFGWALDGDRPDLGDIVGGTISLVGVLLVLFWPR